MKGRLFTLLPKIPSGWTFLVRQLTNYSSTPQGLSKCLRKTQHSNFIYKSATCTYLTTASSLKNVHLQSGISDFSCLGSGRFRPFLYRGNSLLKFIHKKKIIGSRDTPRSPDDRPYWTSQVSCYKQAKHQALSFSDVQHGESMAAYQHISPNTSPREGKNFQQKANHCHYSFQKPSYVSLTDSKTELSAYSSFHFYSLVGFLQLWLQQNSTLIWRLLPNKFEEKNWKLSIRTQPFL